MVNLHEQVRANKFRSVLIMGFFFLFVLFIGALVGVVWSITSAGEPFNFAFILPGILIAIVAAGFYLLIVMSQGASMVLKATGAKPASRTHYPFLYHTTEALAIAAGMGGKVPKCYVIEDPSLNAYATGFKPENSYIVVTTGLLKRLNREEIEGVLAHEMSHIKNQDIKVMLYAAALVGATVLLADILFRMFLFGGMRGGGGNSNNKNQGALILIVIGVWIFLVILSPIIGKMIQMAISRRREYLADSSGAVLTRYPEGLASALEKISSDTYELKTANKATAHLFISNPFKRRGGPSFMQRLFSTHPPIVDRIRRLRRKGS